MMMKLITKAYDRLAETDTNLRKDPELEDFLGDSGIEPWGQEGLLEIVNQRREEGSPISIGLIGCLPKLEFAFTDGQIRGSLGNPNDRMRLEFVKDELFEFLDIFPIYYGIEVVQSVVLADLEPLAKLGSMIDLDSSYRDITVAVQERLRKRFSSVRLESELIDNNYFPKFREVRETLIAEWWEKLDDIRIQSRYENFIKLGASKVYAMQLAVQIVAGMDAYYAIEGIWMRDKKPFDIYAIVDRFPLSCASRTTTLIGKESLPIIFPTTYE